MLATDLLVMKHENLAQILAKHPKQPWVTFSNSRIGRLADVFERQGLIVVEDCEISHVLAVRLGKAG
jgi:hypothetical protein